MRLGLLTNRPLVAAIGASLLLQLAIVLVPAPHGIFGVAAYPTPLEWLVIGALSLAPLMVVEACKFRGASRIVA